jgi:hypothetical protein
VETKAPKTALKATPTVETEDLVITGASSPGPGFTRRRPLVYAAAGASPVKYDGNIKDWMAKIQAHGAEKGVQYSPTAMGLWLREFVNPHSAEYEAAAAMMGNEPNLI